MNEASINDFNPITSGLLIALRQSCLYLFGLIKLHGLGRFWIKRCFNLFRSFFATKSLCWPTLISSSCLLMPPTSTISVILALHKSATYKSAQKRQQLISRVGVPNLWAVTHCWAMTYCPPGCGQAGSPPLTLGPDDPFAHTRRASGGG